MRVGGCSGLRRSARMGVGGSHCGSVIGVRTIPGPGGQHAQAQHNEQGSQHACQHGSHGKHLLLSALFLQAAYGVAHEMSRAAHGARHLLLAFTKKCRASVANRRKCCFLALHLLGIDRFDGLANQKLWRLPQLEKRSERPFHGQVRNTRSTAECAGVKEAVAPSICVTV